MGKQNPEYLAFEALGGNNVAISGTSTESAVVPGTVYRMTATTTCTFRWDTTAATTADGGFSGCVIAGESIDVYCPTALINVIEIAAVADGILFLQPLRNI